jgi:hypothetical protein
LKGEFKFLWPDIQEGINIRHVSLVMDLVCDRKALVEKVS